MGRPGPGLSRKMEGEGVNRPYHHHAEKRGKKGGKKVEEEDEKKRQVIYYPRYHEQKPLFLPLRRREKETLRRRRVRNFSELFREERGRGPFLSPYPGLGKGKRGILLGKN